ncbi:MAG: transglycosylase domain-containing protein, partial [Desulforhabdus sp.]|nr:transglycosylase domain-containing protein [Desulforhabdus sp.]
WLARLHAVVQNLITLRASRGASTITEQLVRILHPRPRTMWSRWLEGIEAARLERRFSKAELLEFYLNQVPYARQRRGVVQAASLYFDRDLSTLNFKEMLALVVLVRAPSSMDLRRETSRADAAVARLAATMLERRHISKDLYENVRINDWSLAGLRPPVDAGHFVQHLHANKSAAADTSSDAQGHGKMVTTLDAALQGRVQHILDSRLEDLHNSEVSDGAVLVVDHGSDEVLAWVNGGGLSDKQHGGWIDAVVAPRQPGSTLKPFLYALALEMGCTPATLLDDSPLAEAIGAGLHSFNNYSRTCYGPVRLRDALGNSLNIPAIRTIQLTGIERFLEVLQRSGFNSLSKPSNHYGAGLALGNGEVTLYELVQAYSVLARGGVFRPLRTVAHPKHPPLQPYRVFSEESASLIADILSDPHARRLEFGEGHLLRLPVQTAVKTGTSNDHRDAWTVGFSSRYVVGVWMGNLNRTPTSGLTGTSGPALVLRAVFAELNRHRRSEPLKMSRRLMPTPICRASGQRPTSRCPIIQEWFAPGTIPHLKCRFHQSKKESDDGLLEDNNPSETITLLQPTQGLELALDPRIPDENEAFLFLIAREIKPLKVEWIVNEKVAGATGTDTCEFAWPLAYGTHYAKARVWLKEEEPPVETPQVKFTVK